MACIRNCIGIANNFPDWRSKVNYHWAAQTRTSKPFASRLIRLASVSSRGWVTRNRIRLMSNCILLRGHFPCFYRINEFLRDYLLWTNSYAGPCGIAAAYLDNRAYHTYRLCLCARASVMLSSSGYPTIPTGIKFCISEFLQYRVLQLRWILNTQ